MRTSAIVGVARRIVEMKGEPQYAGKIGKVDFIDNISTAPRGAFFIVSFETMRIFA